MSDDDITQVVRSVLMNQYLYSIVQFNNAKDTTTLLTAANENANLLVEALKYKVRDYKDQIIEEWIEAQS